MTTHTTDNTDRKNIIYDWNGERPALLPEPAHKVEVLDESLRDGIQSPSALDPPVEVKLKILIAFYQVMAMFDGSNGSNGSHAYNCIVTGVTVTVIALCVR